MPKTVEELKNLLKNLKRDNIIFKPYFYTKNIERPYLSEEIVINSLKDIDRFIYHNCMEN